MLAQAIIAPIGACIVLRWKKLLITIILLAGFLLHILLGSENHPKGENLKLESEIALYGSLGCTVVFIILYFMGFNQYFSDSNLGCNVWKPKTKASNPSQSACPFTNRRVNLYLEEKADMQCPCCLTLIHDSAFYEEDPILKGFIIGEAPCLWKKAQQALERKDSPAIGRLLLDEAMQIRSNFLLGGVGDACIGCITYIKAFQLFPRLSAILISLGSFSGIFPYAFQQLLINLGTPTIFYNALSVYSMFCSLSSLFVLFSSFETILMFREVHLDNNNLPWLWNKFENARKRDYNDI